MQYRKHLSFYYVVAFAGLALAAGCTSIPGFSASSAALSPAPELNTTGTWMIIQPEDAAFETAWIEASKSINGISGTSALSGSRNGRSINFSIAMSPANKPVYAGTLDASGSTIVGNINGEASRSFVAYKESSSFRATSTAAPGDQWEYLVVTNGRVYWEYASTSSVQATSSPPATWSVNGNVYVSTSSAYPFPEESVTTEKKLSLLGREGWELVAVVGAIGGDQEFILKRKKK